MHMYCEFEDSNALFNNKPVYQCIYCGIKLLLDDPKNAKIMCFAKREELNQLVLGSENTPHIDGLNEGNLEAAAFDSIVKSYGSIPANTGNISSMIDAIKTSKSANMCSEEQISERLKICNECEYYKDNSCMLCGCVVIRDANYTNKLAHKDQACPIMKWKQITD
jgi:hypothetical protein